MAESSSPDDDPGVERTITLTDAVVAVAIRAIPDVIAAPPGFFAERRTGELTSRLSADLALLQSLLSTWVSEFSRQALLLVGGVALLTLTHYRLALTTLAAVPGTSNHGLGQAIDLGCGIQNYRSDRWLWMEANGADFGWHHPAWAKSSPFEPWHWEYTG